MIRGLSLLGLIVFGSFASARAQADGTVIPSVCFEAKQETLTGTLTRAIAAGGFGLDFTQTVSPGFYTPLLNPGGATEERLTYGYGSGSSTHSLNTSGSGLPYQPPLRYSHAVGEPILLITDGDAVWGYNNTSSAAVTISRGVSSHNYFAWGSLVYLVQPNNFQPGKHENVFVIKTIAPITFTWYLNNGQATSTANAAQGCSTITYQGRLSDVGSAANGIYDLQIQAFDAVTDGTSESELITLEDVQVTGGVFTVGLKFGSALTNNLKFKFLEIGVRPGVSTGAFTVLTPRQPLTQVPFAVNAQNAVTATSATTATNATNATNATSGFTVNGGNLTLNDNMLRLHTITDGNQGLLYSSAVDGPEFRAFGGFLWTNGFSGGTERMRLDAAGNLTVSGAINGTVANATNAAQLGNVVANQYVLTTDPRLSATNNTNFIQNSTTQQTGNFNITGSGTVGGSLTVTGTINGTVTNATQLGGVAAANYLTSSSSLGQSVTTVLGTASLTADGTTVTYTLVPGLTQTVTVPANSSLVISTVGGIQSNGAINTFSVVDVALFVDGAAISVRRIVIGNFPVSSSVGNWALSGGQTLAAGSHTIEVRARTGLNGSSANVSSGGDPLLRAQLTVTVVKR